jgi:hypothetical protein
MRIKTYTAFTLSGPIRIEKRAIDAAEFLQRRKERKRAETDRREQRAVKHAAAHAFFKI